MFHYLLDAFDFDFFDVPVTRSQGPDFTPEIPRRKKHSRPVHRPLLRRRMPDHRSGMKGYRKLQREGRI